MDPQIFKDALEAVSQQDEQTKLQWLRQNASQLTDEQFYLVSVSWVDLAPQVNEIKDTRTQDQEYLTIAEQAKAAAEAAGASPVQADQAGNAAARQAGATAPVFNETSQAEAEFYDAFGGTKESAQRALDGINTEYGTNYETVSEFVESEMWYEATTKRKIIDTWGGPPPAPAYEFNIGREKLSVNVPTIEAAQQAFGLRNPEDADQFMKLAYANDMRNSIGELAWQPLAALMVHNGYSADRENKRISDSTDLLRLESEIRAKIAKFGDVEVRGRQAAQKQALERQLEDVRNRLQRLAVDPSRVLGPRALADQYREGMRLYNSETFAFFHAIDQGLAARMASNPDVLSESDAMQALAHLQKAGLKSVDLEGFEDNMFDLGFTDPKGRALARAQAEAAANAGGGGRIRTLPDPVAVRQSAKDFYRQMFLSEPDDATLDRFSAQVTSAITAAADDESVDPNARIRQFAETLPEYQKFYGQKPGGMSEEEYQNMHRNAQSSMLGAELADNQPTRVGMMQGDYQTTVGAAMGTKEAWDNSTFMGRLARASQTVGRNT